MDPEPEPRELTEDPSTEPDTEDDTEPLDGDPTHGNTLYGGPL